MFTENNLQLNRVYCMDNLELLKQLHDESIDLIYCDILYNTGKKFKDYDDNLGTPQEAIEWYKPRLMEMKRVLKNTGSIYLQCDYRLVHYLKVEMDKYFNFINHITWKRFPPAGGKVKSKGFSRNADDLLFYSKTDNFTWNAQYTDFGDKQLKKFRKDQNGRYFTDTPLNGCSEDRVKDFEKEGRIYITSAGTKRYKRYLDELKGLPIDVIWTDIPPVNSQAKERTGYDTQKPKELLKRIIKASSNKGDIIADFFCGSGTSLVVAKELGRQYIGCDINPRAIEITNDRLIKVNNVKNMIQNKIF